MGKATRIQSRSVPAPTINEGWMPAPLSTVNYRKTRGPGRGTSHQAEQALGCEYNFYQRLEIGGIFAIIKKRAFPRSLLRKQ